MFIDFRGPSQNDFGRTSFMRTRSIYLNEILVGIRLNDFLLIESTCLNSYYTYEA